MDLDDRKINNHTGLARAWACLNTLMGRAVEATSVPLGVGHFRP